MYHLVLYGLHLTYSRQENAGAHPIKVEDCYLQNTKEGSQGVYYCTSRSCLSACQEKMLFCLSNTEIADFILVC